jgi:hypothetical protein
VTAPTGPVSAGGVVVAEAGVVLTGAGRGAGVGSSLRETNTAMATMHNTAATVAAPTSRREVRIGGRL